MLDEDALIARYFAPLAGPGGLGLKDDAAVIAPPPECDLVVTADALVAGVHFLPDDPAESIARKALAVNLSDLAAKAAAPLGFVLTLALPGPWSETWLAGFAQGLGREARDGDCALLGGDTVKTPGPLTLSITAFGSVPHGRSVSRTGARDGDRLFVSGTVGDGALGLKLRLGTAGATLAAADRAYLLDRYLHPRPRLALRAALLAHASGAMDVSDGLVGDLRKMMRAGGVSADVMIARIPLSRAARALVAEDPARLEDILTGGDDYEVLASVPPEAAADFVTSAGAAGMDVTEIGVVRAGQEATRFRDAAGAVRAFGRGSYSHS